MKAFFSVILSLFVSYDADTRESTKWGKYSVYTVSKLMRQYLVVFNTLRIDKKDKILLLAPNSISWIMLLLTAMSKGFNIYILSSRESMTNIKDIVLNNNINHIFTTEKLGVALKEEGVSRYVSLMSITEIGTIYNGTLVDTKVLFYSEYYSLLDSTTEFNNRTERIEIVPQIQEMDEDALIDWAKKTINKDPAYQINVFSEGERTNFLVLHTFSGIVFEKVLNKIHNNFNHEESVNLVIDYSDWIPIALSYFISGHFFTKKADIIVYDNNTFMNMWREIVESKIQSRLLNWLVNVFPCLMNRLVKQSLIEHLGLFTKLYILDGGKLPLYIRRLLVKSKLPIATTFGSLQNGYVSFMNVEEQIISDLGEPITEVDGYTKLYYSYEGTLKPYHKLFYIISSTDTNSATGKVSGLHILYEKTTIRKKFLWFKQKADVVRRYEGPYSDKLTLSDKHGFYYVMSTPIKTLLNSVRLFNASVVISTLPYDARVYNELKVLLEINQREKEILGLDSTNLDKYVESVIKKLNRYLPSLLQIKAFALVEEGTFVKTRNGTTKSHLYR